jgi:Flp pilus assembly protein TadD
VLAPTPAAAVPPLERAARRERSAGLSYQLALAYRRAGRPEDARRALEHAHVLDPGDQLIAQALERLARAGR